MTGSAEYRNWANMRQRCENPQSAFYADYGGRGITVCKRWCSFEAFLADMGRRPTPTSSIERVDVNGHYEPSNCVWLERSHQAKNRRTNWRFLVDGVEITLADLRERLRYTNTTFRRMLKAGHLDRYQPHRQSA